MKNPLNTLLLTCLTLCALSQESPVEYKKNAIKIDAGKFIFDEVGLSYERWLTHKMSISISLASYPIFGNNTASAGGSSTYPTPPNGITDYSSEKTTYSYFYVAPKFKYFIEKKAPKGFYFGGSLFFVQNKVLNDLYEKKTDGNNVIISETHTKSTETHLNTHAALSFGYNIILFKRLNIDPSIDVLSNPLGGNKSTQLNPNYYFNVDIGFLF